MAFNPYQRPTFDPEHGGLPPGNRTAVLLAVAGAFLAAAYWTVLILLMFASGAGSAMSPLQIVLPLIVIALYAMRGVQLYRGDTRMATNLMWLHVLGGLFTAYALARPGAAYALHGVKLAIHVFGAVTAYLAKPRA